MVSHFVLAKRPNSEEPKKPSSSLTGGALCYSHWASASSQGPLFSCLPQAPVTCYSVWKSSTPPTPSSPILPHLWSQKKCNLLYKFLPGCISLNQVPLLYAASAFYFPS